MRDIPVVLSGYRLTVVEPPEPKTRDDGTGRQLHTVTDRNGLTQFVVSLFVKQRVAPGERVYAHGHLDEKAAALAQLGSAVAGALPSPVAVNPPADGRHEDPARP